jgi:DNA-binding MarR family transcriptional regulator
LPLQILSPLHKASRQIAVHLSGQFAHLGLNGGEAHLLSYLSAYGPCPVGELLRVFGHKPSTLTSILDRLESSGLARRELDPDDRRSFLVSVSAEGRKAGQEVTRIVEAFEAAVLGRVTATELHGFRSLMEAIQDVTQVTLRGKGASHERKSASQSVSSQSSRPAPKPGRHSSRGKSQKTRGRS